MAEKLDAAGRLTEGLPAVDNIAAYVWACRAVGYQDAELTLHAAQVHDWYATEQGLDLRALDADCAALHAAVGATQDALARHLEQVGELSAAWQGRGAEASRQFLRGHGDAATHAAEAVRSAAGALADLRDALWHAVDAKVVAAQTIEDRVQTHRAEWLAAAQTVTTGVGDRAVASELIDQQVKPFVDNDIRTDWVAAMRTAMAAVMDAYDTATAELASAPDAVFEVSAGLGPSWTPAPVDDVAAAPAASVPASAVGAAPAWSAPSTAAPAMPMAAQPAMPAPAVPPSAPTALEPAAAPPPPPTPSLGGMGPGLPDVGSGLSGIGQQLADTLGGLFGSGSDALDDLPEMDGPTELDEPEDIDELDDEEPDDEELDDEEPADDEEAIEPEPGVECQPPEEEPPAEPPAATAPPLDDQPAATAAPLPPPPEPIAPVPPPSPMSAATPCEIAADELPQVGE